MKTSEMVSHIMQHIAAYGIVVKGETRRFGDSDQRQVILPEGSIDDVPVISTEDYRRTRQGTHVITAANYEQFLELILANKVPILYRYHHTTTDCPPALLSFGFTPVVFPYDNIDVNPESHRSNVELFIQYIRGRTVLDWSAALGSDWVHVPRLSVGNHSGKPNPSEDMEFFRSLLEFQEGKGANVPDFNLEQLTAQYQQLPPLQLVEKWISIIGPLYKSLQHS